MFAGIESVKKAIGSGTGISDQEIKESLWYYYFDEDATVAWLKSVDYEHEEQTLINARHRPGTQPRLKVSAAASSTPMVSSLRSIGGPQKSPLVGLRSLRSGLGSLPKMTQSPSVVGRALSALRMPSATAQEISGTMAQPRRQLSQMTGLSSMQTGSTPKAPLLKNFAGRQVPALRNAKLPDAIVTVKSQSSHNAILNADGLASTMATVYAKPSLLAKFILKDVGASSTVDTEEATLAAMRELTQEITGIIEANQHEYVGSGGRGDVALDGQHAMATNFLSGDVSFVSMLVGKDNGKAKKFGFDTPSPDEKVLSAQSGASANSKSAAPKKQSKALPATKGKI
ncbi:hypothetical protein EV181_004253 [Coemansia sp. RSA 532]|nr:hypothetical protein GGH16_001760 [Coemansia sp. RSA 560]KAJ2184686.1 hypothetical protein EV181_004253 [Coemansia sp. RSA 532]KAJ2538596.1 hypothetical protein IWW35_006184 [Coemansia sp. RSA 1878]